MLAAREPELKALIPERIPAALRRSKIAWTQRRGAVPVFLCGVAGLREPKCFARAAWDIRRSPQSILSLLIDTLSLGFAYPATVTGRKSAAGWPATDTLPAQPRLVRPISPP